MNNGDMPASLVVNDEGVPMEKDCFGEFYSEDCIGLTKREHFAGLAMQGMISAEMVRGNSHDTALQAVAFADQLLKALEERPSEQD